MNKNNFYIILLILLISYSCEAPRTNPLDPKNSDNIILRIEGNVKTVSLPRVPLKDVKVYWEKGNKIVSTSSNGTFVIETTDKKNGWLLFTKEGYSTDSTYINWGSTKKKTLNIFLNALPQLKSNIFSSIVLQRYPDIQNYYIKIITKLKDNENDIDSIFFENKSLKIYKNLIYNVTTNYWERRFSMHDLGLVTLDKLIGKNIYYIAKDKNGKIFNIGKTNLKRIIRKEIQFIFPANNQKITSPVTFLWKKYQPGFDLNFRIEIYKNSIPKELVLEKKNIKQNVVSYKINESLPKGTYYWIIYCTDEFGNQGSSKPASFTIEN